VTDRVIRIEIPNRTRKADGFRAAGRRLLAGLAETNRVRYVTPARVLNSRDNYLKQLRRDANASQESFSFRNSLSDKAVLLCARALNDLPELRRSLTSLLSAAARFLVGDESLKEYNRRS